MFRFYSISSRKTLLRSSSSLHCHRSFYTTPINYARKKIAKFEPITRLPTTTEDFGKCLHSAYNAPGSRSRPQADNRRVNIVSKELCSDILERMKPSLLKHTGCDIIDVNPGAGVWSSAVHDLLKPRNHFLLEPDHTMYQPFLQPLVDEEESTYKLLAKSGVVWGHLNSILTPENLPQQTEYKVGDPRLDEPNDTLLFMANLGWYPRKPFRGFPSISLLVVHQFLSAIRAHSLFQRYGLVRMLLWVGDEEGQTIIPKSIHRRRKTTIESEISCSKIDEIASSTEFTLRTKREESDNIRSARAVLKRMDEAGITTPDGRAGHYQLKASQNPEAQDHEDSPPRRHIHLQLEALENKIEAEKQDFLARKVELSPETVRLKTLRKYKETMAKKGKKMGPKTAAELEKLETMFAAGEINDNAQAQILSQPLTKQNQDQKHKLRYLRGRIHTSEKRKQIFAPLHAEFDAITKKQMQLRALDGDDAEDLQREIDEHTAAFHELNENLTRIEQDAFRLLLDGQKTMKNDPPILTWDRRAVEPLKVKPEEFYPKQELCLLDFHPQPIWPVLRENFPASYDTFEFIVATLFVFPTQNVREGLESLAPGAYDWLIEECPSITDVTKGGNPNSDLMTVRCLTLEMFKEIAEAWVKWPFRPSRFDLLRRMGSTPYDPDEEALAEM